MMSHHQLPPDTEADQSYLFVTICPESILPGTHDGTSLLA